jgi:hypothetical protein
VAGKVDRGVIVAARTWPWRQLPHFDEEERPRLLGDRSSIGWIENKYLESFLPLSSFDL